MNSMSTLIFILLYFIVAIGIIGFAIKIIIDYIFKKIKELRNLE